MMLAVLVIWLFGFVQDAISATTAPPAIPVALDINTSSKPGTLKLGGTVNITVTVTALASFKKMQVGLLTPSDVAVLSPSKPLLRPNKDAGPIWDVGGMLKGAKPKVLTFKVKVANPPEGATGDVQWCISVTAIPSLLAGPPAWMKTDSFCYTVSL